MTGFSAEWLALREPADTRARDAEHPGDPGLAEKRQEPLLVAALAARLARLRSPIRFIDLACGTGANFRYLAPRVGGEQQWLLVDDDASLLQRSQAVPGACVDTRCLDLTTGLHTLDFAPDVVVTASALLDLVSDRWLAQLVDRCCSNRCTALFALSYDGRIELTPSDPDDEWIRQLVNRHQLGDKGFGPALGPGAPQRTRELFREAGYQVQTVRTDWHLRASERPLQQGLLEGWTSAAMEIASKEADRCRRWLARRSAHVANGKSRIVVGHEDTLALPP